VLGRPMRQTTIEASPNRAGRSQRRLAAACAGRAAMLVSIAVLGNPLAPAPSRSAAQGAELRLRSECVCQAAVVTLAEVAEIVAADPRQAEALAAIELIPAPPAGAKRFLRLREIQDCLILQGVNLLEHRFSGSSQVALVGAETTSPEPSRLASAATTRMAQRKLTEAIVEHLARQVPEPRPWKVRAILDDRQASRIAGAEGELRVGGGSPPWTGRQRFRLEIAGPEGPAELAIDAQVELPQAAVVVVRSLPRGAPIRPVDVALREVEGAAGSSEVFYQIEDVVGKETTRSVVAGRVLEKSAIREPRCVRRGDVITVHVRSAGIRVRTNARARDDGSLGELISVESLLDRATYLARVSGIQEAEVYARPPQVEPAPSAARSGRAIRLPSREASTPTEGYVR